MTVPAVVVTTSSNGFDPVVTIAITKITVCRASSPTRPRAYRSVRPRASAAAAMLSSSRTGTTKRPLAVCRPNSSSSGMLNTPTPAR